MAETADQTRAEIIQLRAEMTQKVISLRQAARRPIRTVKVAAVVTVGVIVVGTTVFVVYRARERARRRTLRGRLEQLKDVATDPAKITRKAGRALEKERDRLRAELRDELKKELVDHRPLRERVLTAAAGAAANAAVPLGRCPRDRR